MVSRPRSLPVGPHFHCSLCRHRDLKIISRLQTRNMIVDFPTRIFALRILYGKLLLLLYTVKFYRTKHFFVRRCKFKTYVDCNFILTDLIDNVILSRLKQNGNRQTVDDWQEIGGRVGRGMTVPLQSADKCRLYRSFIQFDHFHG